jgi:hypothetical protein
MKLSENNNRTLMLTLHQKIEEFAERTSDNLNIGKTEDLLVYPPNCGLSEKESLSLEKLKDDPNLKSALRKILADNSAGIVFDLMNLLDGTTDPNKNLGKWTEISFVDKTEDIEENMEMFNNTFFETYWDWKEIRPNKNWKLDNLEE